MTGSRVAASCCLTFLVLPLVCSGQSRLGNGGPTAADRFAPSVSVHELKIPEKARVAFNKGTQRLMAKDWAGSIPEFQRAIAAFHEFYEAYYKMGIAQLELKRGEDAEGAFRKSIELSEGRYAPPLFGLGLALGNAGQFADGESFVRAGLNLEPTDAAGHFTLAWVLYAAERVAEAEKSAQQAVLYSPNFAMAHLLLAQIHRRQNNVAALVDDLDAYLRLEPDGPRSASVRAVRAEAQQALASTQESGGSVVAKANR
jgi:tetratricopeptide (TPR) repeat protein